MAATRCGLPGALRGLVAPQAATGQPCRNSGGVGPTRSLALPHALCLPPAPCPRSVGSAQLAGGRTTGAIKVAQPARVRWHPGRAHARPASSPAPLPPALRLPPARRPPAAACVRGAALAAQPPPNMPLPSPARSQASVRAAAAGQRPQKGRWSSIDANNDMSDDQVRVACRQVPPWHSPRAQPRPHAPAPAPTAPQQDITRGRGMVDDLFQGGFGQGGTQNAIMSSQDYISQARTSFNNIEEGYYISPAFLDKMTVHIAKNFMDLPKIKVPLILGIWGGKGQGKTFQVRGPPLLGAAAPPLRPWPRRPPPRTHTPAACLTPPAPPHHRPAVLAGLQEAGHCAHRHVRR